jgi:hypothetical protein
MTLVAAFPSIAVLALPVVAVPPTSLHVSLSLYPALCLLHRSQRDNQRRQIERDIERELCVLGRGDGTFLFVPGVQALSLRLHKLHKHCGWDVKQKIACVLALRNHRELNG